jgi:hypothetical protein
MRELIAHFSEAFTNRLRTAATPFSTHMFAAFPTVRRSFSESFTRPITAAVLALVSFMTLALTFISGILPNKSYLVNLFLELFFQRIYWRQYAFMACVCAYHGWRQSSGRVWTVQGTGGRGEAGLVKWPAFGE